MAALTEAEGERQALLHPDLQRHLPVPTGATGERGTPPDFKPPPTVVTGAMEVSGSPPPAVHLDGVPSRGSPSAAARSSENETACQAARHRVSITIAWRRIGTARRARPCSMAPHTRSTRSDFERGRLGLGIEGQCRLGMSGSGQYLDGQRFAFYDFEWARKNIACVKLKNATAWPLKPKGGPIARCCGRRRLCGERWRRHMNSSKETRSSSSAS